MGIDRYTIIDRNWMVYRYLQNFSETLARLEKCSDYYPMILFPNSLLEDLQSIARKGEDMTISNVMDFICKNSDNRAVLEREWNLYKMKPIQPFKPNYPKKKEAVKKQINE